MVDAARRSIRAGTAIYLVAILLFVLGPLLVVAGVSFTAGEYVAFPPQGLSLRWYEEIFSSSVYVSAALTSLKLAVIVTISATVIGAGAAIALHRGR